VVPATNKRTEQANGRFRLRAKTVRAIKSWAGLEAGLLLPHPKIV